MRLQGRVPSGLEALLRTAPMAYHLIKWGQLLHEEAAALPVAQPLPPARPQIDSVPAA